MLAQMDRPISLGGGFLISGVGLAFLSGLLGMNTAMRRRTTKQWRDISPLSTDRKDALHRVLYSTARAGWFSTLVVVLFALGLVSLVTGGIIEVVS